MDIGEWLDPRAIALRLRADSKRQALTAMAAVASRATLVPAADVLDALLAREAEHSTGVGGGLALPHAALPGLNAMRAVFVRLEKPVDFRSVDDQPVDLILALFAPVGVGSEHLRALARVARGLRNAELRQQLRQARTADAVHALLVREASTSAA